SSPHTTSHHPGSTRPDTRSLRATYTAPADESTHCTMPWLAEDHEVAAIPADTLALVGQHCAQQWPALPPPASALFHQVFSRGFFQAPACACLPVPPLKPPLPAPPPPQILPAAPTTQSAPPPMKKQTTRPPHPALAATRAQKNTPLPKI